VPISLAIIIVIFAALILALGAERFVAGSAALARHFGVSPLVIGITVVGFATSLPEMIVSAMAAWQGNPQMGVGNAIGSNIANIGLVIGVTALVTPLQVHSKLIRREFPLLIIIMLFATALIANDYLSRLDGVLLFSGFIGVMVWLYKRATTERISQDPLLQEIAQEVPAQQPTTRATLWAIIGLILLLISSRLFVMGAAEIARYFGISELVIGLTIVALGTSLPELASSIASVLKGEHDMAIGNVVGSNMFNLLAVLAMPGLIDPGPMPRIALYRDFPIMFVFTAALFAMCYGLRGQPKRISRIEGAVLVLAFVGYLALLAFE